MKNRKNNSAKDSAVVLTDIDTGHPCYHIGHCVVTMPGHRDLALLLMRDLNSGAMVKAYGGGA